MRAVATLWPERWSSRRTWAPSSSTTCGSARARRCECMRPTPAPPAIEASPSARRCTCRGRSRWASAQNKMVLGTWGGDYSKLLTQNVETPLLKPKGIEVVHDIAGDSQRRAKLIAEQRLPRGTTDLQALSAAGSREMFNAGVLETL